jgi:hypothetical protein
MRLFSPVEIDKFLKTKAYCKYCANVQVELTSKNNKEQQTYLEEYNGPICGLLESFLYPELKSLDINELL